MDIGTILGSGTIGLNTEAAAPRLGGQARVEHDDTVAVQAATGAAIPEAQTGSAATAGDASDASGRYVTARMEGLRAASAQRSRLDGVLAAALEQAGQGGSYVERIIRGRRAARGAMREMGRGVQEASEQTLKENRERIEAAAEKALAADPDTTTQVPVTGDVPAAEATPAAEAATPAASVAPARSAASEAPAAKASVASSSSSSSSSAPAASSVDITV